MRTLALTVAYDGTAWAGMQRLPDAPTIQGALEAALTTVLRHDVRITVAGRTDAGVHALGQVVNLHTHNPIPVERVPQAVNRLLPESIRIRQARQTAPGFHARRWAIYRRYWYLLQTTRSPDPLRGRFCWQMPGPLDVTAMRTALEPLWGCHDFAAFCHGGARDDTMRTVQHIRVQTRGTTVIVDIQAEAFLHRMVRLMVSNLVLVGRGERPTTWLHELLQSRTRHFAGVGAPPHGLILMRIGYPPSETPPDRGEGGVEHDEIISG